MDNRATAGRPQGGAISTTLVALSGFAAGAMVMGLVTVGQGPAPAAHDPASIPLLIEQGSELPMRATPPS